ncbi:MAG: hypothetical protein JWM21_323 [Acidobacteria bacterium]|nr:hypothetical protein [Acidobacteriota bacterium]
MPKMVFTFFCLVFLAISVGAQQPKVQPGNPNELKGVTRIYVAADIESGRTSVVAAIRRSLPQLTVTEKAEDAQVWLVFRSSRCDFPKTDPASGVMSSLNRGLTRLEYECVAKGEVIKPIAKETARRLIEFKDTTSSVRDDSGTKGFAGTFIRAYKKANRN